MKGSILVLVVSALLVPAAARADEPTCTSAYGTTACGYDCVAAYGQVKCAATPAGVCAAASGEVTCWDPPRRHGRFRRRHQPKASCTSAYGTTACGYGCVAAYGEVRCASTPGGVCNAAYGEVTCSD